MSVRRTPERVVIIIGVTLTRLIDSLTGVRTFVWIQRRGELEEAGKSSLQSGSFVEILRNGSALPAAGNGGEVSEDGLGTFAWLDSAQLVSDLCIEQSLGRSARKRRCGLCSSYSGQRRSTVDVSYQEWNYPY